MTSNAPSRPAVVVTGANAGIGASIRDRLLSEGWHVIGIDVSASSLPDRADYVHVLGSVGDAATHREAAEHAGAELRAWVNNAGIIENEALHTIADETIRRTIDTNLIGSILGTRHALAGFVEHHRPGAIVNISSIHGRGAFPGSPAYDASKAGIEALTRYAAVEYGHLGIRVNAVAPGAVRTELLERVIALDPDPAGLEAEFAALHPQGRLAEPSEVAAVVSFLLGAEASFINGAIVPVDGGAAARVYAFPRHEQVPGVDSTEAGIS